MSKNVVVVGAQWGDEGKGKIVDWLTERWTALFALTAAITQAIRLSSTATRPFASDSLGHHAPDVSVLPR